MRRAGQYAGLLLVGVHVGNRRMKPSGIVPANVGPRKWSATGETVVPSCWRATKAVAEPLAGQHSSERGAEPQA